MKSAGRRRGNSPGAGPGIGWLLLGLVGCGAPCPSSPSFFVDDLDPDDPPLVDARYALQAFLGRTGSTCIDQVVFSPVARPDGELFPTSDGYTLALPPDPHPAAVRWHVCSALLLERRPDRAVPDALESFVDETRFVERCSDPIPLLPSCTPDPVDDFVGSVAYQGDTWILGAPAPVLQEPSVEWIVDPNQTVASNTTNQAVLHTVRLGDTLEVRSLTPSGTTTTRLDGVPQDLQALTTDGNVLVGGLPAAWDGPTDLRIYDLTTGLYRTVTIQGGWRGGVLVGNQVVWGGGSYSTPTVTDLERGTSRALQVPEADHPGYHVVIDAYRPHPADPDGLVAAWHYERIEPVLSDVYSRYVSDAFLGTLDLSTDTFEVVLRSPAGAGGPRITIAGVTSWGEVMLADTTLVDLADGSMRRPQLPCSTEPRLLLDDQVLDQVSHPDSTWTVHPYRLSR